MRRLLHNYTWMLVFILGAFSLGQAQLTLPWSEDFENAGPDTTFTTNQFVINGLGGFGQPASWGYLKPLGREGRLRLNAGPGFARSGRYALTLDDTLANTVTSPNEIYLSVDLSNYTTQDVQLGFSYMSHNEERHPGDSIWVRASFLDPWVGVYDLWANRGPDGQYVTVRGINISAAMRAAGQTPSFSVQIRFGQEDNGPTLNTTSSDGLTFDDVNLSVVPPVDASMTMVTTTPSGCGLAVEPVTMTIQNYGSTTLNLIPIGVRVNGGAVIRDTIRNLTIAAGRNDTYTLNPGVNLTGFGTYTIEVWPEVTGDADASNDTASVTVTNFTVSTYPYIEGFENGPAGWVNSGSNDSWELTTPALTTINRPAAGRFSWVTSGNNGAPGSLGGYANNENSRVVSGPCFDLTGMTDPRVRFDIWWSTESVFDGAVLQYSLNNGTTWQVVGGLGTGTNWFNQTGIFGNPGGQGLGWSGRALNGNGSNGWVTAEHPLTNLTTRNNVKFRVAFGSDGSVLDDGFAFDNFIIYEPGPTDGGSVALVAPTNGCGLSNAETVTMRIRNYGTNVQNTIPVAYQVNNGTIVRETFNNAALPSGVERNYTFTATADLSAVGTYTIKTWTELNNDPNGFNDTLVSIVENVPVVNTFPYIEDFENGSGGWVDGGQNSSWALGTPSATQVINRPSSGNNSWVTNLNAAHNNNELSFVQGPCFDFTGIANPVIRMNVWWESWLSQDGAYLQASTNGGTTWNAVGAINNPINWYNSTIGWSGRIQDGSGSAGWVMAQHPLTGLGNTPSVLLRMVFESNAFTNADGFAFDDVRIFNGASYTDVAIIAFESPSGQNCSVSDTVKISYTNLGTTNVSNVALSYNYDNNPTVTQVDPRTLQPGDTVVFTFTTTANVSTPGDYEFNGWLSLNSDFDPLNDSLLQDTFRNTTIAVALNQAWTEDFETWEVGAFGAGNSVNGRVPAGWFRDPGEGVTNSWSVEEAPTQNSFNTGPLWDNTNFGNNGGQYIYADAIGRLGTIFNLETPCIDLSNATAPRLEFYYHMFGAGMGSLITEVLDNGTWTNVSTIIGQRQTAETDPWLIQRVDLSAYAGEVIKIRWRAAMANSFLSDMAIDDVSVYEVPPNDVGATALVNPIADQCYTANEIVEVEVTNQGANTLNFANSNIRVYVEMTGPTNKIDSVDLTTGTLAPLATVTATMPTTFDMRAPGTYTFNAWTRFATGGPDSQPFNDSISPVDINNFTITVDQSTPHLEDFETFDPAGGSTNGLLANGWDRDPGDRVFQSWQVERSGTQNSLNTGPLYDATFFQLGRGIYMYAEPNFTAGTTFFLESPCIDFTNATAPRMDFAYHMFGTGMGTIAVDAFSNGSWIPLDSISGQQHQAELDPWLKRTVDLVAFGGQVIKVRFRYICLGGSTFGDGAIDDVLFYQPLPVDGAVTEVISPVDSCGLTATTNIKIRIRNNGTQPLDTIPVAFQVNNDPVQFDTMILAAGPLPPNSDTSFTFTPTGDLSALGVNTVKAWTNLFNDGDLNRTNDTTTSAVEHIITITNFPYLEDWESGTGGWRSQGPVSPWEYGRPNGSVISSAASGTNAWMTGLVQPYRDNQQGWIESPCLDLATGGVLFPMVRTKVWWETRNNAVRGDGAKVQYSIDNGVTWRDLGTVDPDWYNAPQVPSFTTGNSEGWMGANITNDGGRIWQTKETLAPFLSGQPQVKLRVYFESDQFTSGLDGVAIDDFEVLEAPADLRNLGLPGSAGCEVTDTICINVFNASAATFRNVTATYRINNGPVVTQVFPITVNPGDTERLCFNRLASFPAAGTYNITTTIAVAGNLVTKNDTVTDQVAFAPVVNTFPYLQNFDSGSGGWIERSSSLGNSWERARPRLSVINRAASPNNAWVTQRGASSGSFGGHTDNECSWVESPCFDFSQVSLPRVRMNVWWECQTGGDGAVLQSSIDGGQSWQTVGGVGTGQNWYNRSNVVGPNNCLNSGDAWSGSGTFWGSQGWLQAEHLIPGLANEPEVQFRVFFASNQSFVQNGFAFDDFYVDDYPDNDMVGVELLAPSDGTCANTNTDVVMVIRNEGQVTQTSFPIRFTVNGQLPPTTFNWRGNLPSNQSDTVNIGTFNSIGGGAYTITAWTDHPTDEFRPNDTVTATVNITPLPAAPTMVADTIALCEADSTQLWVVNPDPNASYFWYDANTGALVGSGDTIQTTFLARDTAYTVQAATGMTGLKITELDMGGPDFIEIQNLSGATLDATGWTVYIGEDGQTNINNPASRSWNLGVFQAGEVQYREDVNSGPATWWGGNILWNPIPRVGWALIVDDQCNVVDFAVWGWNATQIASFNPTSLRGCPNGLNLGNFWSGGPIPGFGTNAVQRQGSSDSNTASDWAGSNPNSKGQPNPNIGVGCLSPPSTIVVLVEPPINLNLKDQFVCGPATVDAGPGFASYLWNNGATTQSITLNDTITTVSVTIISRFGCIGTDTATVESYGFPPLELGPDTTSCGSIVLDGGLAGVDYIWSNGSNNRVITFNGRVGNNLIWAECIDPVTGCATRDSITVNLLPLPDPGLPTVQSICDSGTLAVNPAVAGLPLIWSTNDTTPSIDVNTSGRYYATLTDTTNGCVGTDSVDVSVYTSPKVSLGPDITACVSAELDAGTFSPFHFYDWSTTQVTQKIIVSQSGSYWVKVTDFNQCTGSDTVEVAILPPPTANWVSTVTPGSTTGLDIDFFDISTFSSSVTYDWDFGDGNTSTLASPSHTYQFQGFYVACLTVTDSCGVTDQYCDTLDLPFSTVGIDGIGLDNAIEVFPTPTRDFVTVSISGIDAEVVMEVNDVRGRLISREIIPRGATTRLRRVDLRREAEGIYLLSFRAKGDRVVRKILKE